MKHKRILNAIQQRPWAILQEKGELICQIVAARANGVAATKDEIQAAIGAARQPDDRSDAAGSIAVIAIFGTIMHRGGMMSDFSGGATIEGARKQFRKALNDPRVDGILIEFDTPGGSSDGVTEFAAELRAAVAGNTKPIWGIANTMACSAGYWLLSQLGETAIVPSGITGSIGCYMVHLDCSQWNAEQGIKPTYITYGKHKAEGNEDNPLSEESQAYLQTMVDAVGEQFVADVATGRGLAKKFVKETMADGRAYMPDDAVKMKMVDRIATFDEMVERMAGKIKRSSKTRAMAVTRQCAACSGRGQVSRRMHEDTDLEEVVKETCTTCAGSGEIKEAIVARATIDTERAKGCQACGGSGLKPERFMSDPQGQEPCDACQGSSSPTSDVSDLRLIADGMAMAMELSKS